MKMLDKLQIKIDKKLFLFLFIILIIGLISGSLLVTILEKNDVNLVANHLKNFLLNVKDNNLNYILAFKNNFFINIALIVFIWLLGISVIGLPVIIFLYFVKCFSFGFIIGSIFKIFKFKGLLFNIIYILPSQIIFILVLMLLLMYAITFSLKISYAIFHKKVIDFRIVMNKYLKILFISFIISFLVILYDTFIMPRLIKLCISHIL